MSRILLKSVAVLGLALASCSMPFMDNDSETSFEAHEPTPPHKGGLADSGDGFAKYFLNHDTNSPYGYQQGGLFDSLLGAFSSDRRDFGDTTAPSRAYVAPYSPGRRNGEGIGKLLLERNGNDPYQN
jgi:hypothetical protein